jgi:tRNA-dihydrouridine synthase B
LTKIKGCPSPQIIREGAGPALLKRRKRLEEIFRVLVEFKNEVPHLVAVGCKIRLGLSAQEQKDKIYLRVIEAANLIGLDYVTVHARHAQQRSRDPPCWDAIAEAKRFANMPIIGNGNVTSVDEAARMMSETGCDGVMIAREAIRNPWVFRQFPGGGSIATAPSRQDITHAQTQYNTWSDRYPGKPKYGAFHSSNFSRLSVPRTECSSDSDTGLFPRNQHML